MLPTRFLGSGYLCRVTEEARFASFLIRWLASLWPDSWPLSAPIPKNADLGSQVGSSWLWPCCSMSIAWYGFSLRSVQTYSSFWLVSLRVSRFQLKKGRHVWRNRDAYPPLCCSISLQCCSENAFPRWRRNPDKISLGLWSHPMKTQVLPQASYARKSL